jgi:hypothetical protein
MSWSALGVDYRMITDKCMITAGGMSALVSGTRRLG